MQIYYVNVYADQNGGWHYGMPVSSRDVSVVLSRSLLCAVVQTMRGRRHVCRIKVTRR